MITTLLVANRGEIACRIFRTARRLGIRTVAVFSDADAGARHVREADSAVRIGGAAPRESYLDFERLIAAARASAADAIHPGYGFLSENAAFAKRCLDAGLTFVGPPPAAIAAMGSKIEAKRRMRAAGVPVLPGYEGDRQEIEHLALEARRLGLPLIVKPAAGGGGKGMQIVRSDGELEPALAAARRLAAGAFADEALLLERYLPAPRHVEVQVFADTHGQLVHLGDRDCSIQRRHQKLIEEAPAPLIPEDVRARLRAAALVVAREIGYVGAGTVEFLFEGREFYFMEMNTRLQVEHTVTEAVTGIDLVEWQLRVASGEPLPLGQSDIRLSGHAIEARVCAEDPTREFLPSAGRLTLLEWPAGPELRVDAGFSSGDEVSTHYDSLLGKVICWAPERTQAALRLAHALDETYCAGVHSNERFLARVLRDHAFLEVRHRISLLDQGGIDLTPARAAADAAVLGALAVHAQSQQPARTPWDLCDGFVPNLGSRIHYRLKLGGTVRTVELRLESAVAVGARVDGAQELEVQWHAPLDSQCALPHAEALLRDLSVRVGDVVRRVRYLLVGTHLHLWVSGEHLEMLVDDPRALEFAAGTERGGLTTPLPGVVVAVNAQTGAAVRAGDVLMVIEAMKMEHLISAPCDGLIEAVHYGVGDRVPEGSLLIKLTPTEPV